MKERKGKTQEKYPWLDSSDERKYVADREILDKYIDLNKSCLTDEEMKQVMDVLYKYKNTFSLRDEIETCANIEVEIDVTDESPFLLDHIMLRKKTKSYRQGNEKIMLLRHIKGMIFSLFQPSHADK